MGSPRNRIGIERLMFPDKLLLHNNRALVLTSIDFITRQRGLRVSMDIFFYNIFLDNNLQYICNHYKYPSRPNRVMVKFKDHIYKDNFVILKGMEIVMLVLPSEVRVDLLVNMF